MVDFSNVVKANSFFGCLSIRTGLFIIASTQLAIGVGTYFLMSFLRPGLHLTNFGIAFTFVISSLLGIWGAWKRSQLVEFIYFITFLLCTSILVMLALDFSGAVHLLPKPAPTHRASFFELRNTNARTHIRHSYPRKVDLDTLRFEEPSESPTKGGIVEKTEGALKSAEKAVEDIPFVPKNETEGEAEEVTPDQLPTETEHMPQNEKDLVISFAKLEKEPLKLFASAGFALLTLLFLYFAWLVLTFVLNKCTSLDELTGQPEQFEPLVGGH